MKYLWIGVCLSEAQRKEIIAKGGKLLSANVSQDALLQGLEESGVSFDSINGHTFPASFAKVKEERFSRTGKSEDVSVAYRNVKYLSHHFKTRALCRAGKEWAKKNRKEDVTILIYSMHSPFLACAAAIKKILPSAKVHLIVPDLPQFMDLHMSRTKKLLKAIDWKKIRRLMKKVDKYILYSRHMASFLGLKDGTWTVMEGSFDASLLLADAPVSESDKISVMYSGVLDLRYGIPELLDAFRLLDDRYELWFTGAGNAVSLINEYAEHDARIHNFGFLPSRRDLLLKQHQASMLISTRNPAEKASAYCFPSKLFEYMVSGNPVLSTRILGIPEEYFAHLIPLDDITPETLAKAIRSVGEMQENERHAFGKAAADFIMENKTNVAQARHILRFINEKD